MWNRDWTIRFDITDTGIGIPDDRINCLFESFSQVDVSTTREYGGTGLGLAISKRLTEMMGGQIGLESEEGKGSTFWFTVMLEKQQNSHEKGKVRILLAEDNMINQQVALNILKKSGYKADSVAKGGQAIEALKQIPYDLVLMDVQMPEMDGFEATKVIRDPKTSVSNHNVPIIAMTAHTMKGDRERCLEEGMDDYTAKPIEPDDLLEKIKKWATC